MAPRAGTHSMRRTGALILAFVLQARGVTADVLDQENAPVTDGYSRCAAAGGLFQSFQPQFTPLAACALDIRQVPAGGEVIHVRLHTGAPEGAVVAEASVLATSDGWTIATFDPPLDVTPGADYVIEWVQPVSWWAFGFGDPYPRGEAYNCGGNLYVDRDFAFRTYAPPKHVESWSWSSLKRILSDGRPERIAAPPADDSAARSK